MHTNYQLDGNTNTEKDRAGLRMLPVSEVLVREVKLDHQRLRAGVRPDDRAWSTTRSRRRAPTTSTARRASASSAIRSRRSRSSSRPARASPTPRPTTSPRPLGGPIRKDKIHFYGAYEYVDRSLDHRRPGHHRDAGERGGARHHAAGERRHPRAPEGQLRVRQDRLPDQPARTAGGALLPLQELLRLEHRRRPDDDGSRDRFHRSHGLGVGAAGVDDREHAC